ncbi:hypothetical protein G4B88_017827 [Cannabis sativa]|uniref:Alpha-N-acetylglucosaminidase tim-barrel domain-containing protein n=1 Tax=Cannabis sativa TaxID=3483 RepID=A0A7J6DK66_CANSA|nr:hypothetical protein G4B88_017827 [Cannabis sativa]
MRILISQSIVLLECGIRMGGGRLIPFHSATFGLNFEEGEPDGRVCTVAKNLVQFDLAIFSSSMSKDLNVKSDEHGKCIRMNWCSSPLASQTIPSRCGGSLGENGFKPRKQDLESNSGGGAPPHPKNSFAWWDWERWEKDIDWMALQKFNMRNFIPSMVSYGKFFMVIL